MISEKGYTIIMITHKHEVLKYCNKNTKFLVENNYDKEKIKSIFIRKKIELIPILSKNKKRCRGRLSPQHLCCMLASLAHIFPVVNTFF